MSLINDALKKAQHQRAEASTAQGAAGSSPRRPKIPRGQLALVLIAAAAVLVVFSVVITVYLLNREPAAPRPAIVATPKAPPSSSAAAPSPVLVAPIIAPVTDAAGSAATGNTATTSARPEVIARTPATTAKPSAPVPSATPSPVAPAVTPAPPATSLPATPSPSSTPPLPAASAGPDPRAQAFVDAIRVTGIRSSGADSKVLMNDHVYRLDDIVERSLGLKLIKVDADRLTFTDPAGHTYTKHF